MHYVLEKGTHLFGLPEALARLAASGKAAVCQICYVNRNHLILCVLNFGTKTPSLPLKKMTKKWQKRAKSAFSNALLGEYFSENCGARSAAARSCAASSLVETVKMIHNSPQNLLETLLL